MEDAQHRARHTAGAPELFISTLLPLTSQRHRWPMTTLGAVALSGKAQGAAGCLGQGSSPGCEDQGRLPGGRGLGCGRSSSAAAGSRPAHLSELLESSLPLSPKDQSQFFLSHWMFYPELDSGPQLGDNVVGDRGHSVRSHHLHQNGALQVLLKSSLDCRQTPHLRPVTPGAADTLPRPPSACRAPCVST